MTKERITQITNALMADEVDTKALFELTPVDAVKVLVEKGYDFTEEELVEYGQVLNQEKQSVESGSELLEDELDDVSGGGLLAAGVAGVLVGYWVYGQKW